MRVAGSRDEILGSDESQAPQAAPCSSARNPPCLLAALFGEHEISFWGNLVPGNQLAVHLPK